MARRVGTAHLPLHSGRVPEWLAQRMARLGAVIAETIVYHYGADEFLRRLSSPFWFQSFGSLMGMDWHSSGITTSVIWALKRGLDPLAGELGLHVCGGRGKHSLKTPQELMTIGEKVGFDGDALAKASRLVAKVDSAALQDGFDLYLHGFIVTDAGRWVVIQQGLNTTQKMARRYHWSSEDLKSFVDAPHAAIEGQSQGNVVNLADCRAGLARQCQLDMLQELGPDRIVKEIETLRDREKPEALPRQMSLPELFMPTHHDVRSSDVIIRRLHATLKAATEAGPKDFADLLLVRGVGARTVLSLAMAAEVVHGAPYRFSDPARFSLAHGGKDRQPFPVPTKVYDQTITVLKAAMSAAKLGNDEKLSAIRRLDVEARRVEQFATGPTLEEVIAEERARSFEYGGRSTQGWEPESFQRKISP